MAHECPECGQTCYCNGDIGDCCFNLEEYVILCTHCEGVEDEEASPNGEPLSSPQQAEGYPAE